MSRWLTLILCLIAPAVGMPVPVAFDNQDLLELQREQIRRQPVNTNLAPLVDAINASNQRDSDDRLGQHPGQAATTYWRPIDLAPDAAEPTWIPDSALASEAQAYADGRRSRRSLAAQSLFADRSDASGRIIHKDNDGNGSGAPSAKRGGIFDKEAMGGLYSSVSGESGSDLNSTTLININGLVIDLGAVRLWNQSIRLAIKDLFQVDDSSSEEESTTGMFSTDSVYENIATGESSSATGYADNSRGSSSSSTGRSKVNNKPRSARLQGESISLSPEFMITARNIGILAACTIVLLLLLPNVFVRSSILLSATLVLVILL